MFGSGCKNRDRVLDSEVIKLFNLSNDIISFITGSATYLATLPMLCTVTTQPVTASWTDCSF